MSTRQPSSPWPRWPIVAALLIAAAAHVPVTPEHLHEAPYMGWLFVAFIVAAAMSAAAVTARASSRLGVVAAGVLCAAAIGAYCLTRMFALPELGDDVGNWGEPLGVISVVSEAVVVFLSFVWVKTDPIRVLPRMSR